MARRRKIVGAPLLLAGVGLMACGKKTPDPPEPPVGNLMAPPTVEAKYCVDVVPEGAEVRVNDAVATERCTTLTTYEGSTVTVKVSHPGYDSEERTFSHQGEETWTVELRPEGPDLEPPVGNLMPPPQRLGGPG
ncbi:MAG: hypothetical protein H6734_02530 [Alphaproteobacteria bacterium]|nr:hypothetical protein [Alphaproteobacteria bacterium]